MNTPAGISFGGNQLTGLGNGTVASAGDINAIAIGNGAMTSNAALKAIALGYMSSSLGVGGVAIGANAIAVNAGDIALGANSVTTTAVGTAGSTINGTAYTYAGTTPASTVSVGSVGSERTITNVAAGRLSGTSTDAVNGSELFATNTVVNNSATELTNINNGAGIKYFHSNSTLPDSTATGTNSVAMGPNAVANNANDVALGSSSTTAAAVATSGTTILGAAYSFAGANPTSTVSVGSVGNERTITNVAAGRISSTSTDAVNGSELYATNTAVNSIIAGAGVKYFHSNSALADSVASGTNSVAIGPVASATASNSIAIGGNASSTTANSIALGSNSVASTGAQSGYTGYGLSAAQTSVGEVSVGASGATRKLTNLAAGSSATDAVNVSQLNQVALNTATTLGGGATYNSITGAYTAPAYSIGGVSYNNVGSALGAQNTIVQAQGSSLASLLGPSFAYNATTGTISGSISYDSNSYSSVQSAIDAITTDVTTGLKYFNHNSTLPNSVANGINSTAIGNGVTAMGDNSFAAGSNSEALSASSVAIGSDAMAQGGMAVSIGQGNTATGNGALAIGDPNTATGTGAIALGSDNTATGQGAIAIGNLNTATGTGSVALGNSSSANGTGSLALGNTATASANNGVALGSNSTATNAGDVALGANSITSAVTSVTGTTIAGTAYTFSGSAPVSAVSVGSVGNERQIQNVAAGQLSSSSTDAVNGSQLFATNTAVNAISSTVTNITDGGGIKYFHTNSTLGDSTAGGTNSVAIGPAAVTSNTATNAVAIGNAASANAVGSIALGAGTTTSTANDVALGTNSTAGAADGGWAGTTIGGLTIASNTLSANAVVGVSGSGTNRQIQGVADGAVSSTSTDAVNGSQLYYTIQALTTAVSAPVAADNTNNLAGPTVVAGKNGLAVGYGATSSGLNSVAVGNGSSDGGRSNVFSVGSTSSTRQVTNVGAGTRTTDAVNVSQLQPLITALGGGSTINTTTGAVTGPTYIVGGTNYTDVGSALTATNRLAVQYTPDANGNPTNQITLSGANNGQPVTVSNVAAGVNGTDAVNVNQLKAVANGVDQLASGLSSLQGQVAQNQTEARRGAATAAAMANLPFSTTPGKWSPAIGYGGFKGQNAIALGIQYTADNYMRLKLRATASYVPGTGDVTFGGGAGWEF